MTSPLPLGAVERLVGGHAALRAAAASGLLSRLAEGPANAGTLAEELNLDADLVTLVVEALAAEGVVVPIGDGRYGAAEELVAIWDRLERFYAGLGEALAGETGAWSVETAGGAGAFYPEVVSALATAFADAADVAAATLARPGLSVLDAGAGGAPWSLAIVAREPSCRVVAVDVPEVLSVTRQQVAAAGRTDRYEFRAADLFVMEPGPSYDLVLAGNLCHLFGARRAAELLRRLAGALAPGGTLAVLDLPADVDPVGDPAVAVYRLGLSLRTREGGTHDRADYYRWLGDAGLVELQDQPIGSSGMSLLTGRRPATRQAAHAGY